VSAISRAKAVLVALALCWPQAVLADVAVPALVGRVVDTTNTLSKSDIEKLNQRIRDFEGRKGSQIAVLIVPTTQPETIEQYSIRAAETWKIGRRKIDDGALLVIAKSDRKLRIEVGYGLEGALTDVTARRIIDEVITPHFRTGDFAGGIAAGITRMIGVIDGERLPPPAPEASHGLENGSNAPVIVFLALFGAIFAGKLLGDLWGALVASAVAGGAVAAVAWFVFGSLMAALAFGGFAFLFVLLMNCLPIKWSSERGGYGGSSSGWSGGGGGWSSGSSSSSSDSGGGGGSFGGGGASGSW
jgi:uncharacterized protein